jgi:hypothetical protein
VHSASSAIKKKSHGTKGSVACLRNKKKPSGLWMALLLNHDEIGCCSSSPVGTGHKKELTAAGKLRDSEHEHKERQVPYFRLIF